MQARRDKVTSPEEIGLRELIMLRRGRAHFIRKSQSQAELEGKRVRFSGVLRSSQYHLVQPEQLLGTIEAQVSRNEILAKVFPVRLSNSTEVGRLDIPVGSLVTVETTLRVPFLGRIHGERAVITRA